MHGWGIVWVQGWVWCGCRDGHRVAAGMGVVWVQGWASCGCRDGCGVEAWTHGDESAAMTFPSADSDLLMTFAS